MYGESGWPRTFRVAAGGGERLHAAFVPVTYQVCRSGEGSVPGRSEASSCSWNRNRRRVRHDHHRDGRRCGSPCRCPSCRGRAGHTEFLFHLVAEGHAFGAELERSSATSLASLKWSRAWRWGCGTGRRARCPWRSACPESGIRGCSNPSSWHHRHPAFREKPRTSRRGCHSCGTRCRRKRTHAGTENDGGKGESGDKSASLHSVYSSNGVFIKRLKPNGLLSV